MTPDTTSLNAIEITQMLQAMEGPDRVDTVARVFVALRSLIREQASREIGGFKDEDLLQATALTNEAYLKIASWSRGDQASGDETLGDDLGEVPEWQNRGHFLASMVRIMRNLLLDSARSRRTLKRGGGAKRMIAHEESLTIDCDPAETLLIEDALQALHKRDESAAALADLHVIGGLTWQEAGEVLGIPERERRSLIQVIKAFLRQQLDS